MIGWYRKRCRVYPHTGRYTIATLVIVALMIVMAFINMGDSILKFLAFCGLGIALLLSLRETATAEKLDNLRRLGLYETVEFKNRKT